MSRQTAEIPPESFAGCLLGLGLGDALGAPFEGGALERLVWRVIGRTPRGETRWTDDTQMSLDLAESLLACGRVDRDDLARRFAAGYRWSRGYGPAAARLLRRIRRGADWRQANRSVHRDGSYGNGGAMRAPVVGLFFAARPGELVAAARSAAAVTHAHPLGLEGAVLLALTTARAAGGEAPPALLAAAREHCRLEPFRTRLELAGAWLASAEAPGADQVRKRLGNAVAAPESCVTAVYVALRFLQAPFLEMQSFVAALGGDVDTIGAMAGALWGAARGVAALPSRELARLEQRNRITAIAQALHEGCS